MSLKFLLDTNVVSSPVSVSPDAKIVAMLTKHADQCALAAPVWHELTFGCARLPRGKRRTALEAYLRDVVRSSLPVLAYDEAAAAWHGLERARLERVGKSAPFADGQIAAVAHIHGLTLVTRNTKDFARFRGLTIVDWSKRASR